MKLELDHFFILTTPEAKAGDELVSLGIEEGFSRLHEGQGTSNRRFPVSNSMLELLWVRDAYEAKNGPGRKLLFVERTQNESASPFGFVFTRKEESVATALPFAGWRYQPDYFETPMAFHVGENSTEVREPLCIYVPFVEPSIRPIEEGDFRSISNVRVTVPTDSMSEVLSSVSNADGVEVALGEEHLMEVTFNVGCRGEFLDLRPRLPLIVRW